MCALHDLLRSVSSSTVRVAVVETRRRRGREPFEMGADLSDRHEALVMGRFGNRKDVSHRHATEVRMSTRHIRPIRVHLTREVCTRRCLRRELG